MKYPASRIGAAALICVAVAMASGTADEGRMPDLEGAVAWLNSPRLSSKSLRGKVVLIDFWTYTCINSLRPLPYVKSWAARYEDAGLVVVGVHKVNDVRAKPGNDVAIKAFRDGTLPFPDGTIIARLAWNCVPSEENNQALRPLLERRLSPDEVRKVLAESFAAGPASLWSRTQENVPRPAAGGALNSTTANLPARRRTKPAFPATRPPKIETLSSPVTHARCAYPTDARRAP